MSFQETLATGRMAESWIAQWLISLGSSVMPAYEIQTQQFKGPQFFCRAGEFISPDMLVFAEHGICWVEAKHKSVFSWYRKTESWTTGIDLHHYQQYQRVAQESNLEVWLLFFHRESRPDMRDLQHGCPEECPSGLFAGNIEYLSKNESHRSLPKNACRPEFVGHGRSGMVYWEDESLTKLATTEEVYAIAQQQPAGGSAA